MKNHVWVKNSEVSVAVPKVISKLKEEIRTDELQLSLDVESKEGKGSSLHQTGF